MFLTNILKSKTKAIMVVLRSTGSNHKKISFREKLADKLEVILFDPTVERYCVYKEIKKLRTLKYGINLKDPKNKHTYGIIPDNLKF